MSAAESSWGELHLWHQAETEIQHKPIYTAWQLSTPPRIGLVDVKRENKYPGMITFEEHPDFGKDLLPEMRSLVRSLWSEGLLSVDPNAPTEAHYDREKSRNQSKARSLADKAIAA